MELLLEEEAAAKDSSLEADGRFCSAFYKMRKKHYDTHSLCPLSISLTILGADPPKGGGLPSLDAIGSIFLKSFFFFNRLAMEGCLLLLQPDDPSVMSCDRSYDLLEPIIPDLCLAWSRGNGSGEDTRCPVTTMGGTLEVSVSLV